MPIVIRYSNYEAETAREHQTLLDDKGYVWWGWWKKNHENYPLSELHALTERIDANSRGIDIGLVERAEREYITARCVECVFEVDSGRNIPTPERDATPAYYADRPFAAWFKLTAISKEPTRTAWERIFGAVPVGDDTFFGDSERGGIQTPSRPIESSGIGLLHISDLHFGSDHGWGRRPTAVVVQSLLDLMLSFDSPPPAAIVVSGDLTTRGEPDGLTSARKFLEGLADGFGLDREAVIVVPGNHDILVDDPTLTRDFGNEQQFRDCVDLFYRKEISLERIHWVRGADGVNYIFSTLNSSRPRQKSNMEYGYVGIDRSQPVLERASRLRKSLPAGDLAFHAVVLHHHVLPAPLLEDPESERPVSLTLDAGEIVSLAHRYEVDAIIHGHQHLPFVGQVSRLAEAGHVRVTPSATAGNILVLGGGSSGVKVERIPDELRMNTVGIYSRTADGLRVRSFQYSPKRKPEAHWDFTLAMQNAVVDVTDGGLVAGQGGPLQ